MTVTTIIKRNNPMENTGQFPRQINSYKLRTAQIIIIDNGKSCGACEVARENGSRLMQREARRDTLLPL